MPVKKLVGKTHGGNQRHAGCGPPGRDRRARNKATYTLGNGSQALCGASNFHFCGVISTLENHNGHWYCCSPRVVLLSAEEQSSRGESGLRVVLRESATKLGPANWIWTAIGKLMRRV
jgi:hypothetical protein